MDAFIDWVSQYENLRTLFYASFGLTTLTYFLSLAYFRGLFGGLAQAQLPDWDGEIEGWLLGILGILGSLIPLVFSTAPLTLPVVLIFVAIFLLLIVLYTLIIRLMYHDLPRWLANLLLAVLILVPVLVTLIVLIISIGDLLPGDELVVPLAVFVFAAFITAVIVLLIVLIYKLVRAIYRAVTGSSLWRKYISGEPQAHTGGGDSATGDPGVTNPGGVLLDPGGPGSGQAATLPPETCIIVDFSSKPIEDHLGVPDLRLVRRPTDIPISVEVSNDGQTWKPCERDASSGAEDYDVPFFGSPWKKVRICNRGSQPVLISDVLDLSN